MCPTGVRNRAWFYLAKVWYARGYLDARRTPSARSKASCPRSSKREKQHLFANILLRPGQVSMKPSGCCATGGARRTGLAYAQFQPRRRARSREASSRMRIPFLTQSGRWTATPPELLALKDRANLALGFAHLQANEPQPALVGAGARAAQRPVLEQGAARHRLGATPRSATTRRRWARGWSCEVAICSMPRYRSPISPCRYAFGKLSANAQSAEYYETGGHSPSMPRACNWTMRSGASKSGNMLDTLLGEREGHALRLVLAVEERSGCAGVALSVYGARGPRLPGRPEELPRPRVSWATRSIAGATAWRPSAT